MRVWQGCIIYVWNEQYCTVDCTNAYCYIKYPFEVFMLQSFNVSNNKLMQMLSILDTLSMSVTPRFSEGCYRFWWQHFSHHPCCLYRFYIFFCVVYHNYLFRKTIVNTYDYQTKSCELLSILKKFQQTYKHVKLKNDCNKNKYKIINNGKIINYIRFYFN